MTSCLCKSWTSNSHGCLDDLLLVSLFCFVDNMVTQFLIVLNAKGLALRYRRSDRNSNAFWITKALRRSRSYNLFCILTHRIAEYESQRRSSTRDSNFVWILLDPPHQYNREAECYHLIHDWYHAQKKPENCFKESVKVVISCRTKHAYIVEVSYTTSNALTWCNVTRRKILTNEPSDMSVKNLSI